MDPLKFYCFDFQFQLIFGPKFKNNHPIEMKYNQSLQLLIN